MRFRGRGRERPIEADGEIDEKHGRPKRWVRRDPVPFEEAQAVTVRATISAEEEAFQVGRIGVKDGSKKRV